MSDEKTCVKCGKKLRAGTYPTCFAHRTQDEKREMWRLSAEQKRAKAGAKPRPPKPEDDDVLDRIDVAKKTPPKSDALKRFRVVAAALGYDADQLIATYCEGWLLAVKQGVDKLEGGGE